MDKQYILETEHLKFEECIIEKFWGKTAAHPYQKTKVWKILNKHNNCKLGSIRWYGGWRKYCYFTHGLDIVLDSGCMNEIIGFMDHENFLYQEKLKNEN